MSETPQTINITSEHPSFVRAKALSEPLRSHFPKTQDEAMNFTPAIRIRPLTARVLVVARTRIECAWAAYVDAVRGQNHRDEYQEVLDYGTKISEPMARLLFPEFNEVPYAE